MSLKARCIKTGTDTQNDTRSRRSVTAEVRTVVNENSTDNNSA